MIKTCLCIVLFGNILLAQGVFLNFPLQFRLFSFVQPPTRCYDELGCIRLSDDWFHPVHRPINKFPEARDVINTTFTLYTANSQYKGEILNASDHDSILNSNFNSSWPTKFIIHGYIDTGDVSWVHEMRDEILAREKDANIIAVDWTGGSRSAYPQSAANTRIVGLEIAHILRTLMNTSDLMVDDVHLIGHSLGAQSASYAAKALHGIGRISALDPASFLFQGMGPRFRLDASDAKFVDVIHTDSGSIFDFKVPGYGMSEAVGHVDFYPNNGEHQPGCELMKKSSVISEKTIDLMGRQLVACSHDRSIRLFIDSINGECLYVAHRCSSYQHFLTGHCFDCSVENNCAVMGYNSIKTISNSSTVKGGRYYLATGQNPYCQKHYKFTVEFVKTGTAKKFIQGKLAATLYPKNESATPIVINLTPSGTVQFNQEDSYSIVVISEIPYNEYAKKIELNWVSNKGLLGSGSFCLFNCDNKLYVKSFSIVPMQDFTEDFVLLDNTTSRSKFTPINGEEYARIAALESVVFKKLE